MDGTRIAALQRAAVERLSATGVPSPRLDASILLAHALGVPRYVIATNPDRLVGAAEEAEFERLVADRARRRPMSHVLGRTEFWALEFRVTDATLAPRPETEMLVEAAVTFLQGRDEALAADVGTGTGCIAISILAECPRLRMHAVDISPSALIVARENAALHGVFDRMTFHEGDLLAPLAATLEPGSLDLVVSNPPYVRHDERGDVDPEVLFEPQCAVFCDGEPWEIYGAIARQAAPLVRSGGLLLCELPGDDPAVVIESVASGGAWEGIATRADLAGHPRMLVARRA